MAFTQADIDALDDAHKAGVRSTTTADGRSVTFATTDEYMRMRKMMLAEVLGSTRTPSSYSVARLTR